MGVTYFFFLGVLPLFWILSDRTPAWLRRSHGPFKTSHLLLCFTAPHLLVWICALGMAPTLDRWIFSRQSTQWCRLLAPDPALWGSCYRFDPFVYDDLTIWLLALAAVAFWYRRLPHLPAAAARALSVLLYWALEEEIQFQPYSIFLTGSREGFSLHTRYGALNASLYIALMALLFAFAAVRFGFWLRRKGGSRSETGTGLMRGVMRSIRETNLAYPLGIAAALLSSMALTELLATEHDKYRDFMQSIVYLALFLHSLELPVRDRSARGGKSWWPYLALMVLLPVCLAGDILMR